MPGMNGLEMIRKMKELNNNVKTIIASSYNEIKYIIEAIDLGVNGYLLKPIDHKKLISLVGELAKKTEYTDILKEDISKKKRAEEALRESEQFFKALLKKTDDLIFIYSGRQLLFVNENVIKRTGYNEQEIYLGEVWDLIHPNDRPRLKSIIEKQKKGDNLPNKIETHLITKSGKTIFVDVTHVNHN